MNKIKKKIVRWQFKPRFSWITWQCAIYWMKRNAGNTHPRSGLDDSFSKHTHQSLASKRLSTPQGVYKVCQKHVACLHEAPSTWVQHRERERLTMTLTVGPCLSAPPLPASRSEAVWPPKRTKAPGLHAQTVTWDHRNPACDKTGLSMFRFVIKALDCAALLCGL